MIERSTYLQRDTVRPLVKPPVVPMEALLVGDLPQPPGWCYEPKWDGFRALIERKGESIEIWSKSGKPLGRYFPEVVDAISTIRNERLLLDGELVVPMGNHLSFAALQARLHPAASRIARLSRETPAQVILFDCLGKDDEDMRAAPFSERRAALEALHSNLGRSDVILSPLTTIPGEAQRWLAASGGALDGVIAKQSDLPYLPGQRAMRKVKQRRTADCVVGGYRKDAKGRVASLLLGLYVVQGRLDLVGFTSAFRATERVALATKVKAHEGGPGFTGRAPGGPSRWNPDKSGHYVALKHELVAEVVYDQVTSGRFRHGTKLLRWRPDKAPCQCTGDQLIREVKPAELIELGRRRLTINGSGEPSLRASRFRNEERTRDEHMAEELRNPKLDEHPRSNTEKDPADWVSGDDPMTGAQASYLTTLCEEAGEDLPPRDLTKAEASQRIDALRAKLGRD
ncbi:ATP-dependent DNA ligase (plasmid) [Novosphingobium sp. BL-8A]|uniref:ATP-dependent DNA ligase n=1 Tax=Novosphingobium sp. BL-8A TaxID=3127639 RepID=UPI003756A20A